MIPFWDASGIVPLIVGEPSTANLRAFLTQTDGMAVWWGTRVECTSAIARRARLGLLDAAAEATARHALNLLASDWIEVEPSGAVRSSAERLLQVHPLRAGDALQLAAALSWSSGAAPGRFVCLDRRLSEAAEKEGFAVQPAV